MKQNEKFVVKRSDGYHDSWKGYTSDPKKADGHVVKKFSTKEEANKFVKYYWRDTEPIERDYWEKYKLQKDENGFLRVCTVDQEGSPSVIWAEEIGKKKGWIDVEESDEKGSKDDSGDEEDR